jgi:hypothetical protein
MRDRHCSQLGGLRNHRDQIESRSSRLRICTAPLFLILSLAPALSIGRNQLDSVVQRKSFIEPVNLIRFLLDQPRWESIIYIGKRSKEIQGKSRPGIAEPSQRQG